MNVAVDPASRRRGVGATLLHELLTIAGGDAQLTLEVRVSNVGAIALYEKLGFLSAGVRRRYYADNGEDALIMWRTPATLEGRLDDIPAVGPVPPSESHQ
jgi:ribosomal-protein-alanine N-acetyltransferase